MCGATIRAYTAAQRDYHKQCGRCGPALRLFTDLCTCTALSVHLHSQTHTQTPYTQNRKFHLPFIFPFVFLEILLYLPDHVDQAAIHHYLLESISELSRVICMCLFPKSYLL